jgi:hypothetical protein
VQQRASAGGAWVCGCVSVPLEKDCETAEQRQEEDDTQGDAENGQRDRTKKKVGL